MSAEEEHQAVTADEADQAFAGLTAFDAVLIAVSGGPDSLALLFLMAEWAKRRAQPTPRLSAATVDHQLRPESAAEAALVAEHCEKLGVPHKVLNWEAHKPWSGLMAGARNARYELLARHLENITSGQSAAVVTAHTLDDQAETLIMRLKRGSGVEGLAAFPARRSILDGSDIQLMRPLLAFAKTRLTATLQARGALWCDDPTNGDAHYERVRVRRLMDTLKHSGVTAEALARTAGRMREASEGLDYGYRHFKAMLALSHIGGIFATFDRAAFDAGPAILRQWLLREVIAAFGGATPRPEAAEVESATARIAGEREIRQTLGGATISAGPKLVRVWREPGRIASAALSVNPGSRALWDDRFWVGLPASASDGDTYGSDLAVSVRALGRDGYAELGSDIGPKTGLPAAAAHGLPAFWQGEALLAVPLLGVVTEAGQRLAALQFICDPKQVLTA